MYVRTFELQLDKLRHLRRFEHKRCPNGAFLDVHVVLPLFEIIQIELMFLEQSGE